MKSRIEEGAGDEVLETGAELDWTGVLKVLE